jgi:predicted GIY-YIG superfamily endonuclease
VTGSGCPPCAPWGFDPAKPAYIYLMSRHGEQQVGITSDMIRRRNQHRLAGGWQLNESAGPIPGVLAVLIERQVKRWIRDHVGLIRGTHENWSTANLEVRRLDELFDMAGVDPLLRRELL